MPLTVAVIFGILGLFLLWNSFQSFQSRRPGLDKVPPEDRERVGRSLAGAGLIAGVAGSSLALASLVAWWSMPLAVVLGFWPIVAFLILLLSGNVTVIHRLSDGSTFEED